MYQDDAEFWEKAVSTREELAEQLAEDPDITLVDLGYPPDECGEGDQVVVRIHVTAEWFEKHPAGCETAQPTVDGIPICIVRDET